MGVTANEGERRGVEDPNPWVKSLDGLNRKEVGRVQRAPAKFSGKAPYPAV
jgi:hypothetical protein